MTPLQWALFTSTQTLDAFIFLIQKGAHLGKTGDELNIYGSELHVACLAGNEKALKFLLSDTFVELIDDKVETFNPIM